MNSLNLNEIEKQWVPVQSGLFRYPLNDGQEPALLANRCKECGKSFFPKRTLCPHCFEQGEMEEIQLHRHAVIYSSTVVHIPSPIGIAAPYAYGYVDIIADNIRVFALFTGDKPDSFLSGREVELVLEPIGTDSQGQQIIGYKFRPAS